MVLPAVRIGGYSLELRDRDGLMGDRASQTAFREMLDAWRQRHGTSSDDPLGHADTDALGKDDIDRAARQAGTAAARAIGSASEEFAHELAHVVRAFRRQPAWRGVERIVVGGGFQESAVGEEAVARAGEILHTLGVDAGLRLLRHHADEGGLVGWLHLAPPAALQAHDAILAVDIGGTNVRCGIVEHRRDRAADLSQARVAAREKWRHADDRPTRAEFVAGIADLVERMAREAERAGLRLAPFVGIACPGQVLPDGSIARGAQNLPGRWDDGRFHLPRSLARRLPRIDGAAPEVRMHNDAVVQGLSELPFMQDVRRWAVLTIGTGLGNACYGNRRPAPKNASKSSKDSGRANQ
ncbi:MAG: ROK family protein [Xylophilus ampelinus]